MSLDCASLATEVIVAAMRPKGSGWVYVMPKLRSVERPNKSLRVAGQQTKE